MRAVGVQLRALVAQLIEGGGSFESGWSLIGSVGRLRPVVFHGTSRSHLNCPIELNPLSPILLRELQSETCQMHTIVRNADQELWLILLREFSLQLREIRLGKINQRGKLMSAAKGENVSF